MQMRYPLGCDHVAQDSRFTYVRRLFVFVCLNCNVSKDFFMFPNINSIYKRSFYYVEKRSVDIEGMRSLDLALLVRVTWNVYQ